MRVPASASVAVIAEAKANTIAAIMSAVSTRTATLRVAAVVCICSTFHVFSFLTTSFTYGSRLAMAQGDGNRKSVLRSYRHLSQRRRVFGEIRTEFPRRPLLGNRVNRGNGAALQAQTSEDERGFDQW